VVDPSLQFCWICAHWSWDWVVQAEESVITLVSSTAPDLLDALTQQFNIGNMALGLEVQGGQQSVQEEYQLYINGSCVSETTDPLKFWEVNQMQFPTLFAITMDYLPIQASSVPCERVFSSSAETDTKKWNRIGPILMEALQMLKFHLKQEHINFLANWATPTASLFEGEPEESAKGMQGPDVHISDLDTLLNKSTAEDGDRLLVNIKIFS
ncbi:hypothetical protein PISMIDRAFT_117870, partial [Pisolithus microcarpus 441]